MTTLESLARRVEEATGPDRELDLAIYRAEFPFPCVSLAREAQDAFDREKSPYYTSSIDAAMTLVPEGAWLTLDRYSISANPDNQQRNWRVWIETLVGDVDGDGPCDIVKHFATGPTPALALTAAALRAHAARGK